MDAWADAPAWDGTRVTTVREALEKGEECYSAPLDAHGAVPDACEADDVRAILLPANGVMLVNAPSRVAYPQAPPAGAMAALPCEAWNGALDPDAPPPTAIPAHHVIRNAGAEPVAFFLIGPAGPASVPPAPVVLRNGWGPAAALAWRPPPPPVPEGSWRLPRRASMLLAEFLGPWDSGGFSCACRAGHHAVQPPHPVLPSAVEPLSEQLTLRQALLRARNPLFPASARLKAAALREIGAHCGRGDASRLLLPGGRDGGSWAELVAATRHSARLARALLTRILAADLDDNDEQRELLFMVVEPLVEACDGDLVAALWRFNSTTQALTGHEHGNTMLAAFGGRWAELNPDCVLVRCSKVDVRNCMFVVTAALRVLSLQASVSGMTLQSEDFFSNSNRWLVDPSASEEVGEFYRQLHRAVLAAEEPLMRPCEPWESFPVA